MKKLLVFLSIFLIFTSISFADTKISLFSKYNNQKILNIKEEQDEARLEFLRIYFYDSSYVDEYNYEFDKDVNKYFLEEHIKQKQVTESKVVIENKEYILLTTKYKDFELVDIRLIDNKLNVFLKDLRYFVEDDYILKNGSYYVSNDLPTINKLNEYIVIDNIKYISFYKYYEDKDIIYYNFESKNKEERLRVYSKNQKETYVRDVKLINGFYYIKSE
ncbi:MAG: hypothetical protein N4A54_02615 [Peptostreptococcaceae bacterium]|jgi:hypothetical protein|nr:hypothetical protein [Peptostreptococcaceae bacterium]